MGSPRTDDRDEPGDRNARPEGGCSPVEMHPFTEEQLEELWAEANALNRRLADILRVAGWTGLRWSELRAIRVRDFVEVPLPLLIVQRAAPEGVDVKVTKSGKGRRVPLADRVLRRPGDGSRS